MCAKLKQTIRKIGKPLPLNEFHNKVPDILLLRVFSFLGPEDLKKINLVCKLWSFLMEAEETWREAFIRFFSGSPLKRIATSWRSEYLKRIHEIRTFGSGRLQVDYIDSRAEGIDSMVFADSKSCQNLPLPLAIGHSTTGCCSLLDLFHKKFKRYVLFDSSSLREPTCLEMSRSNALIGFSNGQVACAFYNTTSVSYLPIELTHGNPITALGQFSSTIPKSMFLGVSGCQQGIIRVWDIFSTKLVCTLTGLSLSVENLLVNSKIVVGIDSDQNLCAWRIPEVEETSAISPLFSARFSPKILDVHFYKEDETILIVFASGSSQVINLSTTNRVSFFDYGNDMVTCHYHSPSLNPLVAFAYQTGKIRLFGASLNDPIRTFFPRLSSSNNTVAPSSIYFDEVKMAGLYENNVLRVWDLTSSREIRKIHIRECLSRKNFPFRAVDQSLELMVANRSHIVMAVGNFAVTLQFGIGPERSSPRIKQSKKVQFNEDISYRGIKSAIQEIDEGEARKEVYLNRMDRFQGALELTESEALQYAISLSKEPNGTIPTPSTTSINETNQQFELLGLSEEEAVNYAIFLSREE